MRRAIVLGAAALAFILKLLIDLKTYGTNDAYAYELFAAWSQAFGVSVYRYWAWNNPPFTLHMVRALAWASQATNLPFSFWLRFMGIAADAGSGWLVWRMLRERLGERTIWLALVFFALSPTTIMISGFHGNTDAVMVLFILLAIFSAQELRAPWVAGAAFGMAMGFKVVPLILIPVFLLWFESMRKRAEFVLACAAVVLLAWSPYIFQEPATIVRGVFGYKSFGGIWGLSFLLDGVSRTIPEYRPLAAAYRQYGVWALFALIGALSLFLRRSTLQKTLQKNLFAQAGLVLLVFMSLTNGFGVQYLAWLCPFVVALGAEAAGVYFLTSGVFLFVVYNFWSEGLPWYLADSNRVGAWHGSAEILQVLCWLSVCAAAWLAWKRANAPVPAPDRIVRAGILALPALSVLIALSSIGRETLFRHSWLGSDEAAITALRARNLLDLAAAERTATAMKQATHAAPGDPSN